MKNIMTVKDEKHHVFVSRLTPRHIPGEKLSLLLFFCFHTLFCYCLNYHAVYLRIVLRLIVIFVWRNYPFSVLHEISNVYYLYIVFRFSRRMLVAVKNNWNIFKPEKCVEFILNENFSKLNSNHLKLTLGKTWFRI